MDQKELKKILGCISLAGLVAAGGVTLSGCATTKSGQSEKDTEKTRVVFRKFPEGDILALFPELSEGGAAVESYQHIGQHGGADYVFCIRRTVPANPEEYQALAAELEDIGYDL